MANGLGVGELTKEFKGTEFDRFLSWVQAQYGRGARRGFTLQNYKDSGHYRFWVQQGRPSEHLETAEEKYKASFHPIEEGEEKYYGYPQVPAETRKGLEVTTPWLYTGQTEEQYKAERPWLQLGMTEQDFLRSQYGLPTAEEEEAQRWQARRDIQSEMWANERARQGMIGEKYNWMAQRMAQWNQPQEGMAEAEKARIWESAKAEILGGLTGDRDWMKRWEVQNRPNPYQQERTTYDEMKAAQEEVKMYKGLWKDVEDKQKDPTDPLYMPSQLDILEGNINPDQQRAYEILSRLKTAKEHLTHWTLEQAGEREESEKYGAPPEPARPTTPATPAWLSKLQPTMGERVGKMQPAVPSGQAWGVLSPAQQQQWAGWAEWSGYKPEDTLWQAQQMLSQPRRGPTWQAARQPVSM